MESNDKIRNIIHDLKHHLPAQAPLKDFIHHNTLHAFQNEFFFKGLEQASQIFGIKTLLSLSEYRNLYEMGSIGQHIMNEIITKRYGEEQLETWKERVLHKFYFEERKARVGQLRKLWKHYYHVDIDTQIQSLFFRVLCNYLDQGIAIWSFPVGQDGFLNTIKALEQQTSIHIFQTKTARKLLHSENLSISLLLQRLVGDEEYYEQYLFDQQFMHQGWSGMASIIESEPQTLLDKRKITLEEVIIFELLLEIDTLTNAFGENWKPLCETINEKPIHIFEEVTNKELFEVYRIWHESYEWTYYDSVLAGLSANDALEVKETNPSFQALFCIDDRECSFRRYLEDLDKNCTTYGTPGFFGVEFYFQPQYGNYTTKVCPAPVSPKFLIKETNGNIVPKKELMFHKNSHQLLFGWIISQSLGIWSAFKLAWNIFKPSMSPVTSYSFRHMDKQADLTIEHQGAFNNDGLKIGFSIEEMAIRVENLLKSIGLVDNFAPIVYVIGHGSTSVNNTYYAGYDCGACSGRPGSVNARVIAFMANHSNVREILATKNIVIPNETQFIGALRDTSRDTILFYDAQNLNEINKLKHHTNELNFFKASDINSKERSRRFESINTKNNEKDIHEAVKSRSVSLFEPRPEYNHATNTLCIVGRRGLTKNLFLDRRSFLNSYDYRIDPEGKYLLPILNAIAPVCGGINLEYFFSRTDNQKLGAGTKLAHNVMGLIGVANGIDGDLRPGLPSQMIEIHDPMRLLVIVEHYPNIIIDVIIQNSSTYEWFDNNWIHLVCIHPETKAFYRFESGQFIPYHPTNLKVQKIQDLTKLIESTDRNIPVMLLKNEIL